MTGGGEGEGPKEPATGPLAFLEGMPGQGSIVDILEDEFATTDSELSDGIPAGAYGDVDMLTPEAIEHVAAPLDLSDGASDGGGGTTDAGARHCAKQHVMHAVCGGCCGS